MGVIDGAWVMMTRGSREDDDNEGQDGDEGDSDDQHEKRMNPGTARHPGTASFRTGRGCANGNSFWTHVKALTVVYRFPVFVVRLPVRCISVVRHLVLFA